MRSPPEQSIMLTVEKECPPIDRSADEHLHDPMRSLYSRQGAKGPEEQTSFLKCFSARGLFQRLIRLGPTARQAPHSGCPRIGRTAT